jgi:hypothetical protein
LVIFCLSNRLRRSKAVDPLSFSTTTVVAGAAFTFSFSFSLSILETACSGIITTSISSSFVTCGFNLSF